MRAKLRVIRESSKNWRRFNEKLVGEIAMLRSMAEMLEHFIEARNKVSRILWQGIP